MAKYAEYDLSVVECKNVPRTVFCFVDDLQLWGLRSKRRGNNTHSFTIRKFDVD